MDPNAALEQLRKQVVDTLSMLDAESRPDHYSMEDMDGVFDKLDRLATTFEHLDDWISSGGFLPDSWQKGPRG